MKEARELSKLPFVLDPAQKAVLKLRKVKRYTPGVFTPLVAYVGALLERYAYDEIVALFPG